jgi:3-isopropylmalate/(R)-2-methylmalate dehydratase small subunit
MYDKRFVDDNVTLFNPDSDDANLKARFDGRIIYVPKSRVDTDLIIPKRFLSARSKDEVTGEQLFPDVRAQKNEAGEHIFPFGCPEYQGCSILFTRKSFGCGSSREHAAWALQAWGIKAIAAHSFEDIFSGNCAANGLPCVTIPMDILDELAFFNQKSPGQLEARIDLKEMILRIIDMEMTIRCDMDPIQRQMVLSGKTSWDLLNRQQPAIEKFYRRLLDQPPGG